MDITAEVQKSVDELVRPLDAKIKSLEGENSTLKTQLDEAKVEASETKKSIIDIDKRISEVVKNSLIIGEDSRVASIKREDKVKGYFNLLTHLAVEKNINVTKSYFEKNYADNAINRISNDVMQKALSIGTMEGGGLLVPTDIYPEIKEFLLERSILSNINLEVIDCPTGTKKVPIDTIRGDDPTMVDKLGGANGLVDEAEVVAFDEIILNPKMLKELVVIPNSFLQTVSPRVMSYIMRKVQRTFGLYIDKNFLRGNGQGFNLLGLIHQYNTSNALSQTGTTLANVLTDFNRLITACVDGTNQNIDYSQLRFIFSAKTGGFLRSMSTTTGDVSDISKEYRATGKILGIQCIESNIILNTYGGGTNESEIWCVAGDMILNGVQEDMKIEFTPNATYETTNGVKVGRDRDESVFRIEGKEDYKLAYRSSVARLTGVTYGN